MAILIRNAYVFAPKELGVTDVLMVGEKILAVAPNLSASLPGLSIIDATGFILAPGFVDAHVHVLGGGGVNGPDTRAPAISAGELIRAGITTVVGVLGADVMTRKLPDLLAKVRELKALGLSAWMYTSNFRYPPVTLTQSVADDVALVSEVLGAKLAMGDVNGSFPSSQAILEMLSQIRQAALTVNKQGLLHVHLGSIPNPFDIFEEIAASGFPIGTHLRPTHCARTEFLLKSACAYAMGASDRYIDITTDGPCYLGHPAAAVSAAVSCGGVNQPNLAAVKPASFYILAQLPEISSVRLYPGYRAKAPACKVKKLPYGVAGVGSQIEYALAGAYFKEPVAVRGRGLAGAKRFYLPGDFKLYKSLVDLP